MRRNANRNNRISRYVGGQLFGTLEEFGVEDIEIQPNGDIFYTVRRRNALELRKAKKEVDWMFGYQRRVNSLLDE